MNTSLKKTVFEYAKLSSAHFIFLTSIIPLTGAIVMGEKNLFLLTILFLIGLSAHVVGVAFNHYIDIEVDRLMASTNKRPLPSGSISKRNALLYIGPAAPEHRILTLDRNRVTSTTVRVPVLRCHSEAINVELEKPLTANEARAALAAMPGVLVYDDPVKKLYPMPLDATGKDEVYVGRIREDESITNGLNLWVVSDNLRKGAALNAIQIAECLVQG